MSEVLENIAKNIAISNSKSLTCKGIFRVKVSVKKLYSESETNKSQVKVRRYLRTVGMPQARVSYYFARTSEATRH